MNKKLIIVLLVVFAVVYGISYMISCADIPFCSSGSRYTLMGCKYDPCDFTGGTGAELDGRSACRSDSDCEFDANSDSCCSNGRFPDQMDGICPTEGLYRFKGYCTCNIPEGWEVGQCNGLERTEPLSDNPVGNVTEMKV